MSYLLFEDDAYLDLLPLTFTRPIYQLRVGIYTFLERWIHFLGPNTSVKGISYASSFGYSLVGKDREGGIWINARFLPNEEFLKLIESLEEGDCYVNAFEEVLCFRPKKHQKRSSNVRSITRKELEQLGMKIQKVDLEFVSIATLTDLFTRISDFLKWDFQFHRKRFPSQEISDPHTCVYYKDNIWIGEGAKIEAAILHAESGPIYIGPGVSIQPGAIIMGGHCIGEGSVVAAGAKLRANSSFGKYTKLGGEIKNSLVGSYSNKGHEGYMGNTVLGIGCNWGAATDSSNMKNTFSEVKQWSYRERKMKASGQSFCGTVMGDFSRTGIHTMLNTGTVVGVSSNIFGAGFLPKFIPSYSWGGEAGSFSTYRLPKAINGAISHLGLKGISLSEQEKRVLSFVFEETASFRYWE